MKNIKNALKSIVIIAVCISIFACTRESIKASNNNYISYKLYNKILSYYEKDYISYSKMISYISDAAVVFLGEYHNSQKAHLYELKIIKSLHERDKNIAIAMEMFERDIQPFIDDYIDGNIDEKTFLNKARPWTNYKLDYRPIIEFAKTNKIRVIAINTPSRISKKVVYHGKEYLQSLSLRDRQYIAKSINFKNKVYRDYFYNSLPVNHPVNKGLKNRLLLASIVKDETMAESISRFLYDFGNYKVIVIAGKFHSDYGIAIPQSLLARIPKLNIALISLIPLAEGELVNISDYLFRRKQADFYIFSDDKKSY